MNQTSNSLASCYPKSLVQPEAASSFLSMAGTETGRRAFLDDVGCCLLYHDAPHCYA